MVIFRFYRQNHMLENDPWKPRIGGFRVFYDIVLFPKSRVYVRAIGRKVIE
uniref:Uncharacterized protein n=1 Tax=Candidatus Kentrum sp. FW TaxID=2126338 RepID=A0A450TT14_9GAMM|nr:MAG: hypothetical protein BECKFW1821C_GA0114237_102741 [Candidatus Kentron sp. FW]